MLTGSVSLILRAVHAIQQTFMSIYTPYNADIQERYGVSGTTPEPCVGTKRCATDA